MISVGDVRLATEAFFQPLDGELWARLLVPGEPVWAALDRLGEVAGAAAAGAGEPAGYPGAWFQGDVRLGEGVTIEPGAYIIGPAILGDGAHIRHGAYLRGNVVVGAGCVVGHASELKHSILLPGAAAPHFNYVGDSILGAGVNLGAGTICSNVKLARGAVAIGLDGQRFDTGRRKLGAILGDGCQTGCNTVLNPGTLAGPDTHFYPGSNARGYFPPRSVVKTSTVTAHGTGRKSS